MDQNEANDYAARGAVLLDEKKPEWLGLMNVDTLDMTDGRLCVLGQVYATEDACTCCNESESGYNWGRTELDVSSTTYGFNSAFADLSLLGTAWKALITARRDVVVVQLAEVGWLLSRDSLTMLSPTGETHEISADIALA